MTDKKTFLMGVVAVVIALISISMSGWILLRLPDILPTVSGVASTASLDKNKLAIIEAKIGALDTQLNEYGPTGSPSLSYKLDLVYDYLSFQTFIKGDELDELWAISSTSAELGIQYIPPAGWSEAWVPINCYTPETCFSPEPYLEVSVPEGSFPSLRQLGLGCRITRHAEIDSLDAYFDSIKLGQVEDDLVSILSKDRLIGAKAPSIIVSYGGENASSWERVLVALPDHSVEVSAGVSRDVNSMLHIDAQRLVQEKCLEVAKTIEPLQE